MLEDINIAWLEEPGQARLAVINKEIVVIMLSGLPFAVCFSEDKGLKWSLPRDRDGKIINFNGAHRGRTAETDPQILAARKAREAETNKRARQKYNEKKKQRSGSALAPIRALLDNK